MTNQLWSASLQLPKFFPERFKGIEISDECKPNHSPLKLEESALKLEGLGLQIPYPSMGSPAGSMYVPARALVL